MRKATSISFTGPNVLSIRAGAKTNTRRLVTPQPGKDEAAAWAPEVARTNHPKPSWRRSAEALLATMIRKGWEPPYAVGDQLWVKETWGLVVDGSGWANGGATLNYKADGDQVPVLAHRFDLVETVGALASLRDGWRSPRFMPRWASRLSIEITGLRVERLQAISHDDAIAEGVEMHLDDGVPYYGPLDHGNADPRAAYREMWETIHGAESWEENPWVWALTFKQCEQRSGSGSGLSTKLSPGGISTPSHP